MSDQGYGTLRPDTKLILASQSLTRRQILENCGLAFTCQPARIDEEGWRKKLQKDQRTPAQAALELAREKARIVDQELASPALILAADQLTSFQESWLGKPLTQRDLQAQLRLLRNQPHDLHSAVVIWHNGQEIFQHIGHARLTMRNYSDAFITSWVESLPPEAFSSVAGCQIEGLGAHCLAEIQGDYFTILGLPLLPVLGFLRKIGYLPE